jgi:hypothetical protein
MPLPPHKATDDTKKPAVCRDPLRMTRSIIRPQRVSAPLEGRELGLDGLAGRHGRGAVVVVGAV